MVLLVTMASFFVDRDRAGKEVIAHMEGYVPITGEMQHQIFDTIAGVIKAREKAGAVALLVLVWAGLQCFTTLICASILRGEPPIARPWFSGHVLMSRKADDSFPYGKSDSAQPLLAGPL